jgi:hypothetical protein
MPVSRANERLLDMVATTKAIYANPQWVVWADGWLSGRDRSVVSAERILSRIRALQSQDTRDAEDASAPASGAARPRLHQLADLLA